MSHDDSVYEGLLVNDAHWAFGTDFEDPLAGVDMSIPDGIDPQELAAYCLELGDDALILSHRLSEWCSRAPDLEDDIALANIALDLLGQARLLLARAAAADPAVVPTLPEGSPAPAEDALAFFRTAEEFRNQVLCELPRGDFAEVVQRLQLFARARLAEFKGLVGHPDPVLSAIAAKAVKELSYHVDYAERWCEVLDHGTDESRRRMASAREALAPYAEATRDLHTPHLAELLDEMQSVARAHPLGVW